MLSVMRDTALVGIVVQSTECSSVLILVVQCSVQSNVECGWRAVVHERRHQWSRGRRPEQLDHTCPTNRATVKISICESLSLRICEFVTLGIFVFLGMSHVF